MIPFHQHDLTSFSVDKVAEVLSSQFITSSSICAHVEIQLKAYFGVEYAFLTNSWTNGGIAALLALGIKPGDEVIVPAMSFIATSNIVCLLGAVPVFVDVDPDTLLMDYNKVEDAITPKTRCIIPVHLYGLMCDIKKLRDIIMPYGNIAIIEDSAHCFEGEYEGCKPGTYSDFAIFSFYATKNITCGEGGAVITNDPDLAERFKAARLHGMTASADKRYVDRKYKHWEMEALGAKANLPDLLAVYLQHQIDEIDKKWSLRKGYDQTYRHAFENVEAIRLQHIPEGMKSALHVFPIHVAPDHRDELIAHINDLGMQVAVHYRSIPSNSFYKREYSLDENAYPESKIWGDGQISLPLYPNLGIKNVNSYIDAILNYFR